MTNHQTATTELANPALQADEHLGRFAPSVFAAECHCR